MMYFICFLIFIGCHILREIILYTFGVAPSTILVTIGALALCGAYTKYYRLHKPDRKILKKTKDFYENNKILGVSHEQFSILVNQYSDILSINKENISDDKLITFKDIIQIILKYNLTNDLFANLKEKHDVYCSDGDKVIKLVTITRQVLNLPNTPKEEPSYVLSQPVKEIVSDDLVPSSSIQNEHATSTVKEIPKADCEEKLFCRKCGAQLRLDSVFCDKCGTKVINLN